MAKFKFAPLAKGLNWQNAIYLAEASCLAYKSKKEAKDFVAAKWEISKFYPFAKNGTEGFLIGNSEVIILAFRGTEQKSLTDWLTDLKMAKTSRAWGKVHRGFATALSDVSIDIKASFMKVYNGVQPLWVTGHSLGGALATLFAGEIHRAHKGKIPIGGVYTFGQPRVGDGTFAANYDAALKKKTFRFVNHEDIVPEVPPQLIWGYEHIGKLMYFNGEGVKNRKPQRKRLEKALSIALKFSKGNWLEPLLKYLKHGISDHAMDKYVENVKKRR